MKINVETIKNAIENSKARSAWDKGVTLYALELLDNIRDLPEVETRKDLETALLSGARDWKEYSWGGCSLCYNSDIAERLCTPSELQRRKGGEWRPSRYEEWLDVQARALSQACRLIFLAAEGRQL